MKMNNNQNNNNNLVYQYTATATQNINYNIKMGNDNVVPKLMKTVTIKQRFEPGLQRAKKALQLVNPFRGV